MSTTLLLPIIALIIGLIILVWSSDIFIDGAASTAKHFNISPLIIGIVVLGFGTSMPEMLVSTMAALDNSPGIAIGNAVGSNIVNIGLVLGVTALIAPILVKSSLLKRELPVLLLVSLIAYGLILDGTLSVTDGIILIILLIATLVWMIKVNKNIDPSDPLADETLSEVNSMPTLSLRKGILFLIIGLTILILSAKTMVWGAVEIAHAFGVPELIIGLTIIAVGTSLPELAASISAALKNEADLVIGNIVGSNLFNILAVLAVPAILSPSTLDRSILTVDFPVMLGFTAVMLLMALPYKGQALVNAPKGLLLSLAFVAYLGVLYVRTVTA
ncbi:calcium/sodium antiporter [Thiomicrorhabdus aquaedulcis]|uniref:calcium/sodium antiporter n=1 Tax=Thiomicrorhabdus aquaedulcis TaxID=2211106 RepID=UPI000FD87CAA|nr:calcium/sodium antiporter [Thiomicrorhabdus aquaedulcis]